METKDIVRRYGRGFHEPTPMGETELRNRFELICGSEKTTPSVWGTLKAAYSETHRRFHTLQHIEECLQLADQYAKIVGWPDLPPELELAIWFHDVVYEPGIGNNEQRSVDLLQSLARDAELVPEVVEGASALILETKDHEARGVLLFSVMCDCDLWILGASPERYANYSRAIRHEFRRVPRWLFERGRRAFLTKMLKRRSLYTLPLFEEAFAQQARANMRGELTRQNREERSELCGAG